MLVLFMAVTLSLMVTLLLTRCDLMFLLCVTMGCAVMFMDVDIMSKPLVIVASDLENFPKIDTHQIFPTGPQRDSLTKLFEP